MKKAKVLFFVLFLVFSGFMWAETQGDKLFKQNKPREAIAQLEKEIASGKASYRRDKKTGQALWTDI